MLWGQRDAVRAMLREDTPWAEGAVRIFLRDTHDHTVQLLDLLETSRDLAAAILEIHLWSVRNRTNEIMKTLTVMASIFIPLTFLTQSLSPSSLSAECRMAGPWPSHSRRKARSRSSILASGCATR